MHLSKRSSVLVTTVLASLIQQSAFANPYASGVKVSGTTLTTCTPASIRYVVNEDADGDGTNPALTINIRKSSDNSIIRTVTFTSAAPETRKGVHNYTWDKKNNASAPAPNDTYYFELIATDTGHASWTLISTDAVLNNFERNAGLAVNKNNTPGNEYFGRIYVTNGREASTGAGRTMASAVYVLNADFSETDIAPSGPRTGGVSWQLVTSLPSDGGGSSPFRLTVGPDNKVYITDWSDFHAGLWIADPDITAATEVLIGTTGQAASGLDDVNGSISDVYVTGTGANRKIYSMDEDFTGGGAAARAPGSIWRYDIGTALMTSTPPTIFFDDAATTIADHIINSLNSIDFDGTYYWITQSRGGTSGGEVPTSEVKEASLMKIDSTGALLYASVPDTYANASLDVFKQTQSLAYGDDLAAGGSGKWLALATARTGGGGLILIVNPTTNPPSIITTFTFGGTTNDDCSFDAAGNLYVGNQTVERVRCWAPPTTNPSFTTKSASFTLTGTGSGGPNISVHPQSQTICLNSNVMFSVTASGSGVLSYQWLRNGVAIPLATSNSLTVNADGVNYLNGDSFTVSICDVNGVTLSNPAILTIPSPPVISPNPFTTLAQGQQNASFISGATSTAVPSTVTYQWYKGTSPGGTAVTNGLKPSGTTISGATSGTLAFTSVHGADAGGYYLRATDVCNRFTDSGAAFLLVVSKTCGDPFTDADSNGVVDMNDFGIFQQCFTGTSGANYDVANCGCFDRDNDSNVDNDDLTAFIACGQPAGGHRISANPACDGAASAFAENFDVDHTANWSVNASAGGTSDANFFFDYNSVGIPPAPHTVGGTTRGLRLRANFVASGASSGVSVSPTGQSFTGNYTVQFDVWQSYNPPVFQGGTDSTQLTTCGVATSGGFANVAGTADCVWFGVTGDGQNGNDYRAYDPGHTSSYGDGSPVYAAGANTPQWNSRNAGHPYYSNVFGGTVENIMALPAMVAAVPSGSWDSGAHTDVGTVGYAWRVMKIQKAGNYVLWSISEAAPPYNLHLIAAVDTTASGTLGGTNIMLGQSDLFANSAFTDPSTTSIPTLLFGLIDNLTVTPN